MDIKDCNDTFTISEEKQIKNHKVSFLKSSGKTNVFYSTGNYFSYVNNKERYGCLNGPIVDEFIRIFKENEISDYEGNKYIKTKLPQGCKVTNKDEVAILFKTPYLVDGCIKVVLEKCKVTGEKKVNTGEWSEKALELFA